MRTYYYEKIGWIFEKNSLKRGKRFGDTRAKNGLKEIALFFGNFPQKFKVISIGFY